MRILQESEDFFHDLTAPGSYEWTYFDGLTPDGTLGFAAIWFRGIPMSPYYTAAVDRNLRGGPSADPAHYSAFNFNVYHHGRRIFYALHEFPKEHFRARAGSPDVRVGSNSVQGGVTDDGVGTYLLYIDTEFPLQKSRAVGEIELIFRPQNLGDLTTAAEADADEKHFWVPAALDGDFRARIDLWKLGRGVERLRFGGRGYHDRNFGVEPLHHLVADWHWGRVHSDSSCFVYFHVAPDSPDRPEFRRMLLLREGRAAEWTADIQFRSSERQGHWATLPYHRRLQGSAPALGFTASERSLLDSGPFYHRILGDLDVSRNGMSILRGPGITEFLRPSRLAVAAFRPFVKFRMRRK